MIISCVASGMNVISLSLEESLELALLSVFHSIMDPSRSISDEAQYFLMIFCTKYN